MAATHAGSRLRARMICERTPNDSDGQMLSYFGLIACQLARSNLGGRWSAASSLICAYRDGAAGGKEFGSSVARLPVRLVSVKQILYRRS